MARAVCALITLGACSPFGSHVVERLLDALASQAEAQPEGVQQVHPGRCFMCTHSPAIVSKPRVAFGVRKAD